MTLNLELQIVTNVKTLPHPSQFKKWVKAIVSHDIDKFKAAEDLDLTIRVVDEEEMINLNSKYRNNPKPTNVLSFEGQVATEFNYNLLGDIVICANVIEEEARQQNKDLLSHWAHMVIHGVLHLLGYDHEHPVEAEEMEFLEIELMRKLGFASPYESM